MFLSKRPWIFFLLNQKYYGLEQRGESNVNVILFFNSVAHTEAHKVAHTEAQTVDQTVSLIVDCKVDHTVAQTVTDRQIFEDTLLQNIFSSKYMFS